MNCVWVHAVFGTKGREPWITESIHPRLHTYLRTVMADLRCPVAASNGMADHVHLLFLLDAQQSVANVMMKAKANSSRWLKEVQPSLGAFGWQNGYAAFAVSPGNKDRVIAYILNQEEHHRVRTFEEEYAELVRMGELALEFE
jgi:REP element-mobilizing transposase RayT